MSLFNSCHFADLNTMECFQVDLQCPWSPSVHRVNELRLNFQANMNNAETSGKFTPRDSFHPNLREKGANPQLRVLATVRIKFQKFHFFHENHIQYQTSDKNFRLIKILEAMFQSHYLVFLIH
jgi:hypothetical protein